MLTQTNKATTPAIESMFDTAEDKAVRHAYAILQDGEHDGKRLTYEHIKLLRVLVECRGAGRAKTIGHLAELVKSTPRQLKSDVHDLRQTFRVRIGSSRDGDGGGFYLITTAQEAIETAQPLWNQALAMMAVVKAILTMEELQALERKLASAQEGGR